jgi:aryl-alcohol dehydrogenase-like predicted oxidoreductase
LHNLDANVLDQIDVVAEVFGEAQQQGKVRWTGASGYGTEYPRLALETDVFDMLQVPYSVFDRRLDDEVIPMAANQDVGIVSRSILLKGALTPKADHLPDRLETLRSHSRRFRDLVEASGLGLTPVEVAIAFGLAHPHIGTVLVGVRTKQELTDNLKAIGCSLPDDLLTALLDLRLDDADLLNPGTWGIP